MIAKCIKCNNAKHGEPLGVNKGSVTMLTHLNKTSKCCEHPYYFWIGEKNE